MREYMLNTTIEQWVEIDSSDGKNLKLNREYLFKDMLKTSLTSKTIKINNQGQIYYNDGSELPLTIKHKGKLIGLKCIALAPN